MYSMLDYILSYYKLFEVIMDYFILGGKMLRSAKGKGLSYTLSYFKLYNRLFGVNYCILSYTLCYILFYFGLYYY
jgi:hypothetical protein